MISIDLFHEAPFNGVTRGSVQFAINELHETAKRYEHEGDLEKCCRLDVVAHALEETLADTTIDWLEE